MSKLRKILLRKRRKKESRFHHLMGILHLWMGLLSSVVIMTVCFSGCLYAFKNQISDWTNREKVFITPENTVKRKPDLIVTEFQKKGQELTAITIPESSSRSYVISYRKSGLEYSTFYNPYNGTQLGAPDVSTSRFFDVVLDLHRNLLLGTIGRQINGSAVLTFCFLLFSGGILWIPKKWKHLKQALTVKFRARFHRLNYDFHTTLGFYTMLMLFFMAVTGLYITYPWVKNILIVSLGGEPVSKTATVSEEDKNAFGTLFEDMLSRQNEKKTNDGQIASLGKILQETGKILPYPGATTIEFPNKENPRFTVTKMNTSNMLGAMLPDEITFDRQGSLKSTELFSDKPLNKQFTSLAKPLHTGEILGLKSIIFYFLICLIGVSLPVTGFLIWWHKFVKIR